MKVQFNTRTTRLNKIVYEDDEDLLFKIIGSHFSSCAVDGHSTLSFVFNQGRAEGQKGRKEGQKGGKRRAEGRGKGRAGHRASLRLYLLVVRSR